MFEIKTFTAAYDISQNDYKFMVGEFKITTGDFNGDGKSDLVHFVNNNYVRVWLSKGDGTFDIKDPFPNNGYNVGSNNFYYFVEDLNGDWQSDLVHVYDSYNVRAWFSGVYGTFDIKTGYPNNGYVITNSLSRGDYNGDGRWDIVNFINSQYVHVWLSKGDGTFDIKNQFPSYWQSSNNYYWDAGLKLCRLDLNRDGRSDIISFKNNNVRINFSNGDGAFYEKSYAPGYDTSSNNYKFEYGDFDGNGKGDLIHFVDSANVRVWLSKGDGTFDIRNVFPTANYNVAENSYRYYVGDFNGDGKTDVLHLTSSSSYKIWFSKLSQIPVSSSFTQTITKTGTINFGPYISDIEDADSALKVLFTSLPSKGVLSVSGSNSSLNTQYLIGGISYNPNDSDCQKGCNDSLNYKVIDTSSSESSISTVNILVSAPNEFLTAPNNNSGALPFSLTVTIFALSAAGLAINWGLIKKQYWCYNPGKYTDPSQNKPELTIYQKALKSGISFILGAFFGFAFEEMIRKAIVGPIGICLQEGSEIDILSLGNSSAYFSYGDNGMRYKKLLGLVVKMLF